MIGKFYHIILVSMIKENYKFTYYLTLNPSEKM